MSTEEV
ncbi:hypothetical protein GWI33_010161, partial [Rhynchophorus ferrugineus]